MKKLLIYIFLLVGSFSVKAQYIVPFTTDASSGQRMIQQAQYGSTSSLSSHTINLSFTPRSGNLLVLVVYANNGVNTPAGWTLQATSSHQGEMKVFSKVAGGAEPTSIAVTLTGAGSATMGYVEFSGRSGVVDKVATTSGTGTTSMTIGPTAATTQASEIIVAASGLWESTGNTWGPFTSWDAPFTQVLQVNSTVSTNREYLSIAVYNASAINTYSATSHWTVLDTDTYDGAIVTFK